MSDNFFLKNRSNPTYKFRKEFSLLFEISLFVGCPINCNYCPQIELYKKCSDKYISFEDYKKFISTVPKKGMYLVFAGFCDPLLYDDLENVIKYTYDEGYNMLLATALPTKNKKNVELFLDEKYFKGRTVHLKDSSMNKAFFDDSYYEYLDRYLQQVHNQQDKNKEYKFSFLGEELEPRIMDLLIKNNLQDRFKKIIPFQRIDAPVKSEKILKPDYKCGRLYCSENFYKKQMLVPGGDVVMCCMDVQKKHVLGNLHNTSYEDIYKSEEYKKIMRGFNDDTIDTICRRCIWAKNY